jgi:hypothetical protein
MTMFVLCLGLVSGVLLGAGNRNGFIFFKAQVSNNVAGMSNSRLNPYTIKANQSRLTCHCSFAEFLARYIGHFVAAYGWKNVLSSIEDIYGTYGMFDAARADGI